MPSHLRSLCLIALLGATASIQAQYAPPPPARPFPGFANERLRADNVYMSAWDIAANYRLRYEDKRGAGFTDAGSNWDFSQRAVDDTDNSYLLSRLMPRVGYTGKRTAFLLEGRLSSSIGDERYNATAPGKGLAENDSGADVHQAFVFIGNHKEFPLSLKIGRQELVYGDQRLIGHFRWNNNARTFDAIKVRWQNPVFGVDLFTGGVVYNDSRNLNRSNSQDHFSGAYFNFPTLLKNEIAEAYLLARNVERGIATDNWSGVPAPFRFPGAQDVYTAGVRVKSKPNAYGPIDYGVEAMYQFGNRTAVFPATAVAAARAAPRLDHRAIATVLQAGYTWSEHSLQPRFALIYSYGSGDKSATDSKSGTFQNLFPTNHLFYGYMDLSSLQNLHDIRLAYTIKPGPTSMIAFEAHSHFLGRTTDFWYNVAGVPRNVATAAVGSGGSYRINPGYSRHVGNELDVVAAWTFRPYAQIEVAASRYFRGDYIKQSLAAVGSKDASYYYLQFTLNL
ncbi:alginate export family protein [Horticoccus sp. 23ND18S-11]|uniref:alginate export family protein n=1 Tax=Horticoccus sp. 23ND18S-11 TaxID=3391832 RepID=UPI0039C94001